jgi:type IV secretion system protein VirB10
MSDELRDSKDRGITNVSALNQKKSGFIKYLTALGIAGLILGLTAYAISAILFPKDTKVDPDAKKKGEVVQTLPPKTFSPPPEKLANKDGKLGGGDIKITSTEKGLTKDGKDSVKTLTPVDELRESRFASDLTPKTGGAIFGQAKTGSEHAPLMVEHRSTGGLGDKLNATATPATSASILRNRSLILAKGAMIPCVLKTRIDSTVPGMTSCVLPQNLYSDDGKTVLAERGSEMVGEYQSGLLQGQERLFVLWTRIKTTKGVVINLDSPGTDPLGGAGMPGYVDNHFFQRFGAAILLSVITDGLQTLQSVAQQAATKSSANGSSVVYSSSSSNGQTMASEALRNSINIPPTLYKNHGDRIAIFVARDLSFESVYDIRPL